MPFRSLPPRRCAAPPAAAAAALPPSFLRPPLLRPSSIPTFHPPLLSLSSLFLLPLSALSPASRSRGCFPHYGGLAACGSSRRRCPLSVQRSAAARETDGRYERGEEGRERGEDRRRGRVGNAGVAGTHPSRRTPGSCSRRLQRLARGLTTAAARRRMATETAAAAAAAAAGPAAAAEAAAPAAAATAAARPDGSRRVSAALPGAAVRAAAT
jgi:biotin carboxyl carrier protein